MRDSPTLRTAATWPILPGVPNNGSSVSLDPSVPNPVSDNADSAIDESRLRDIVGNDPVKIERYLRLFADLTSTGLAQLAGALADGSTDGVRRLGHKIKGSCGMVGAKGMAAIAAEIEHHAGDGQLDDVPALLGRLQRALEAARPTLLGHEASRR